MSSSMMRGIQINNPPIGIKVRDNMIIEIDDSNDDSDEDTLHIAEDSIDELIEIDDSESDEQAIDLSIRGKYATSKLYENGHQSNAINTITTPRRTVDQATNVNMKFPTLKAMYPPPLVPAGIPLAHSTMNPTSPNQFHHHPQSNASRYPIPNLSLLTNGNNLNQSVNGGNSIELSSGNLNMSITVHINEEPIISESFVYQCEFCSESFSSDQQLIDHCARMHTKNIKCQHCEKTFYWEKDLHFHMRKHIKKGRGYKCQICTGLFMKLKELKDHMKVHDMEDADTSTLFTCDICDKQFKTSKLLQEHKKRFFHKQCEVCLDYFSSDATLFQHFSVHVTQQTTAASYGCDQCDEVFPKKSLLKAHRDKHRLYVCELCSAEFRRKDDIRSHLTMDCTQRNLYNCPACNKSFLSENSVLEHVESRHYGRNKCEFCSEKFMHATELEDHLARHNIEHPYQCQICLAPMSSKRIFNFHLKSHNEVTKYKCEKCCRWFQSSHLLQNHLKKHSRDRFNCTICKMSFSENLRLDQHLRSHSEDQYQCDICKRSFRTRQLIFVHMIDAHQSRKNCHICQKEFMNQRRLMTHLKSHYVKVEFPDDVEKNGM